MQFLHKEDTNKELTYEDTFLVPQYSEIASRMDVDLTPQDGIGTTIPLVVSNMNSAAGKRMAETVTRRGGLVVLPQDMPLEKVRKIVSYVKSRHPLFETPVVLEESESIQTALNLIYKRAHGAIVVVDSKNRPIGIFTEGDAKDRDKFTQLKNAMSTDIISMDEDVKPQEVFDKLQESRVSIMPIVKKSSGELLGILTNKSAVRATMYEPATNKSGEFLTAVATGINKDLNKKLEEFVDIGIDIVALDMAHGHSKRMIDGIKRTREIIGKDITIFAGTVTTADGVEDLVTAGADIIKVGIGAGAVCTTRIMTASGRPQFSAVHECAKKARQLGAHVWADGGIRHPRDLVLAIAAGASSVMFGSLWAGTYESPSDIQKDEEGRLYKEHFGMAGGKAVSERANDKDPFTRAKKLYFQEGSSGSKMYLKEGYSSAEDIIDKMTSGLRSACSYSGAKSLEELHQKAVVGVQTSAAFDEGKPLESW